MKEKTMEKGFVKKKKRTLVGNSVDYKDVELLEQFITEKGKILPRRITGVSHHHQRLLNNAIKRARHVALLPFAGEE